MRILKKILAVVICICIAGGVLYLGGYTFGDFATSIGLKNPADVFGPFFSNNNTSTESNTTESNTTESTESVSSTTTSSNGGGGGWFPDDLEFSQATDDPFLSKDKAEEIKEFVVKVGSTVFTVTKDTVADFIKWLQTNYNDGDQITIEDGTSSTEDSSSNQSTSSSNTSENNSSNTNENTPTVEVTYNNTLQSIDNLQAIVKDIEVVESLPNLDDYDRTSFESPVKSYTLNGKKVNRNDYSWKTSKWFNEEDFTYTCPYTGTVIHDLDDKKADNDFSNIDYDHIVPLKSAYLRGASNWTKEQQNEYAYNQWVGVDVLNSANRSKSDKGPADYLPAINVEDYCYSWLLICSKYDLVMTKEEIDICTSHIYTAIAQGESVDFIGGSY